MTVTREDMRQALLLAAPVMMAYVSIGIPCGVMEAQVGFTPLMAFLFSASYYSGAGQFMVPNLWLAGTPLASIFLSVSFVTSRQLLYSAAFSPHLRGERAATKLAFASLVTDESFGVNLGQYAAGAWDARRAILVNIFCALSWSAANALGAALGAVIDLPIDVMSFGMTAIFICLLAGQRWDRTNTLVAAVTAAVLVVGKLLGLGGMAIFASAVVGVATGVAFDGGDGAEK